MAHDGNHWRARYAFGRNAFFTCGSFRNFFCGLLFEGDHIRIRSEEARHLAGQLGVQRLVDGSEHAARQQTRN